MRFWFMSGLVILLFLLTACGGAANDPAATLPPGDASRGAQLFTQSINGAPPCSTCHSLDGSALVGPSMQGYAERVASHAQGKSPEDYTRTSIVSPAAYIVDGYSNLMFGQYAQKLSPQQISDLIAYLLTL